MLEGEDAQSLLLEICDTYEGTRWNGNNNVGCWSCDEETWTPDYTVPVDALEQMIERDVPSYWSAADWLSGAWSECKEQVLLVLLKFKDRDSEESELDALADEWIAADTDAILDRADVCKQIDLMVEEIKGEDIQDEESCE